MEWTSQLTPGGSAYQVLEYAADTAIGAGAALGPAFDSKGDGELRIEWDLFGGDTDLCMRQEELDVNGAVVPGTQRDFPVATALDGVPDRKFWGHLAGHRYTLISMAAVTRRRVIVVEINQ